jgi:hypothetical protein
VSSLNHIHVVKAAANAIYKQKTCHFGKDATILGLAPISSMENYHVTPLVLSSLCKTERGDALAEWIRKFIEAYQNHPYGERVHGPIHTLATDGESSFRRLRFILGLGKGVLGSESRTGSW